MRRRHERNCIYRLLALMLLAGLLLGMTSAALAIDEIIPQSTSLTVVFKPGGVNGDGANMRLYRVADMPLYVSAGTGMWAYAPMRWGSRSEIGLLVLERKD